MQRNLTILACFFIGASCLAQQYPFVHYTPKDGLVSNRVRSIYQDSKGRMYFNTVNGLSVYDGARFTNYTKEDGLHSDIVNCVMEMGDDSIWVVTNNNQINCLVNRMIKTLITSQPTTPIINYLSRTDKGALFAAADDGLFLIRQNAFEKLPFIDMNGDDINSYIAWLIPVGNYLLAMRDPGLLASKHFLIYLYDPVQRKIVSQTTGIKVFSVAKAEDGRIWASTDKGIKQLSIPALDNGKIVLQDLPFIYNNFTGKGNNIFFDNTGACWLGDPGTSYLTKCDRSGNITIYTPSSGLGTAGINFVFRDKEGIIWLATNGGGVNKLMHTNFSLMEKPYGLSSLSDISLSETKNEVLLYSFRDEKLVRIAEDQVAETFQVKDASQIGQLVETTNGLFGILQKKVFRMDTRGLTLYPRLLLTDTSQKGFLYSTVDHNDNLILYGEEYLTAVIDGRIIYRQPVTYLSDQVSTDAKGNVWIASRAEELIKFSTHPGQPATYLRQEAIYKKELVGISPRSITIDENDFVWIGTRNSGLYVYEVKNGKLIQQYHFTAKNGLSENFVSFLGCDKDNNIWVCTPSGLDKISYSNRIPVIENVTIQNNIYQSVSKVVIDKNNTVWALASGGLIKVTPENSTSTEFTPRLMVTQIRAGSDILDMADAATFSYRQNSVNFYFAAVSFLDEKQIRYSYKLEGGSNRWSEPSNIPMVLFTDLRPGNYTLDIKAAFPAGRYPEQSIQYKFSITPPWWQTWWFRIPLMLVFAALILGFIRTYYRRKLEKQRTAFEKQQAIEQERSRIATDMHDDLGSGLTRIKFITENMEEMTNDLSLQPEMKKLKTSSNELVEKMAEIIWAMNEKNNTLEDLLFYLRSYAVDYCTENKLLCEFTLPEKIPNKIIGGQVRRNVFLVLKESLHNIVKHAAAKRVKIIIRTDDKLSLTIADDGKGFEQPSHNPGNGLLNMEQRASALKGRLWVSQIEGTTIQLEIPV